MKCSCSYFNNLLADYTYKYAYVGSLMVEKKILATRANRVNIMTQMYNCDPYVVCSISSA